MRRIVTAAIVIPFALAITWYLDTPNTIWIFAIIDGVIAALMLNEYLQLVAATGNRLPPRWFLLPGGLVATSFAWGSSGVGAALVIALFCLMTSCIATSVETALSRVMAGLSGVFYCCFLLGFMILLSR